MRHGNMYAIVIVLITLSLVSLGHAQIVWKKTIDFTDNALQFHVDANGNSILSGANDTRKYDANGNEAWRISFGGANAVTSTGDIYIKNPTELRKYSSTGSLIWQINDNSTNDFYSQKLLFVDRADNPIVFDRNTSLIKKYSPTGSLIWSYTIPLVGREQNNPFSFFPLCDIGSDTSNNTYIAYFGSWPLTTPQWTTLEPDSITLVKLNGQGAIQFSRTWNVKQMMIKDHPHGDGLDDYVSSVLAWSVNKIIVDASGNTYIPGQYGFSSEQEMETKKTGTVINIGIDKWLIRKVTTQGTVTSKEIKGGGQGEQTNYFTKYSDGTSLRVKTHYQSSQIYDLRLSSNGLLYATGTLEQRKTRNNNVTGQQPYGSIAINPKLHTVGKFAPYGSLLGIDLQGNAFTQAYLDENKTSDLYLYKINQKGIVQRSSSGIPKSEVTTYLIDNSFFDSQGNLYTATNQAAGLTLMKVSIPSLVSIAPATEFAAENSTGVSDYKLNANYPNPFNPTTNISFSLAEQSLVTVKVFNMLGQEVATLANQIAYEGGENTLEFNATNLPSGVYYYRIVAEGVNGGGVKFTSVKKMMLMK